MIMSTIGGADAVRSFAIDGAVLKK